MHIAEGTAGEQLFFSWQKCQSFACCEMPTFRYADVFELSPSMTAIPLWPSCVLTVGWHSWHRGRLQDRSLHQVLGKGATWTHCWNKKYVLSGLSGMHSRPFSAKAVPSHQIFQAVGAPSGPSVPEDLHSASRSKSTCWKSCSQLLKTCMRGPCFKRTEHFRHGFIPWWKLTQTLRHSQVDSAKTSKQICKAKLSACRLRQM